MTGLYAGGIINLNMKARLAVFLVIISVITGISAGGYFAFAKGIPSIAELKQYKPTSGARIYADDDTLIGELKVEKGIFVPLNKMPKHLIDAVIAVEDSRFWNHKGIDYIAIGRAVLKDILHAGLKEGGSTITQQLAKVVFLTPEKTLKRKVREVALAIKLEKSLDKKEILELYLNRIYFGHGAYGIEMASRVYFGKSVGELTLPEAAMIAALIKAPSTYSPYNNLTKSKERQETVLLRMEEEGYIKRSEREKAAAQPLYLSTLRRGMEANNYFIEYVRKYLEEKYGEETVYKGGLKVYTTLDRAMQAAAQKALQKGLRELDKRRGWRGPVEHKDIDVKKEMGSKDVQNTAIGGGYEITSGLVLKVSAAEAVIKTRGIIGKLSIADAQWASVLLDTKTRKAAAIKGFNLTKILKPGDIVKVRIKGAKGKEAVLALEQEPEVEGAVAAIEQRTGFIRTIIGGYDYTKSGFNRAIHAKRQPGSAFKPIIYAAAMDNGFTPASIINDEPVTYKGGPKGDWTPENYDHKHYGPTRLREALTYSRNVITVKLVEAIGVDKVIGFARSIGFTGDMPYNLSIALGSISVTPLELASGYAVFANGGIKIRPAAVKYIADSKGKILESNEPEGTEVISRQTAFLITSMMQDVINHGTGWRIKALGRPAAGKTGTTNDYRDAWFVGYTTGITTAVWVGFDDVRPLGSQETGARAASPIWLNFMKSASNTAEFSDFSAPEGIVIYPIDPLTGLLSKEETASSLKEYFKDGTQPTQFSTVSPSPAGMERKSISNPDFD
ncbi:MAG: penicillin-binding protein [Nitrospirae bacterium CG_4_10_14_3_um_filter_44_29]|nr:MAG: penicillin-binding protein [Nitrospirae bacterium CG22_combo_CG10-13_8_21_14_all_44_11]PIV44330.1 MAG: penicillin-binding protein [Nitrospirae bacterium CG02_land_8_20_14_3_00_44_33]PIV67229.1 MAG: penicillin-binding protein [Nitrospirae bacterium CG01_land_8_20_14_3_00_44_22]PIW90426.1 MAG: penicillin-binding protein [Nitrospirae bacterium CG_4_8_14_3_um_filter_44_28]PIX89223.1 MAG: penicillin-binding protein [Nitrospirae bacterium CG_4_10_14_3_um_filter_44_29]PJA83598.1 MAG: penicill